ncbi:MAG: hypothetical protein HN416_07070 [Nitrospina sp.]|jgi:hypothetical protein|nr:hypothetical protein [Nitrospina sp.]
MENSVDSYVRINSQQHGNLAISLPTFKRAKGRIERQSTLRKGITITSREHGDLLLTRKELKKAQLVARCLLPYDIHRLRKSEIQDKVKSSKKLSRQRNTGLLLEAKRAFYAQEHQGLVSYENTKNIS